MPTCRDPYLDDGMRGWIAQTARSNLWRVAGYYELDDLIQDGYMCYAKCHSRYTHLSKKRHPLKDDRKRFMRLVQVSFENHITTLAWKRTRLPEQALSNIVDANTSEQSFWEATLPATQEHMSAAMLLKTAPQEIQALFKLLVDDALSLGAYARGLGHNRRRIRRETNNEYYCRALGLDPKVFDLIGLVNRHFLTG